MAGVDQSLTVVKLVAALAFQAIDKLSHWVWVVFRIFIDLCRYGIDQKVSDYHIPDLVGAQGLFRDDFILIAVGHKGIAQNFFKGIIGGVEMGIIQNEGYFILPHIADI